MNIYFDTEFTGLHKDTTLISIGLVSDDDQSFYAELTDYERTSTDAANWGWLEENVLSQLLINTTEKERKYIPNYHVGSKKDIAIALRNWLSQYEYVQLVSDCCHYDMVLFIDIFGGAFDIPSNVCAACYDINQDIAKFYNISQKEAFDKNREDILPKGDIDATAKHNALYDAYTIRAIYHLINDTIADNNAAKVPTSNYTANHIKVSGVVYGE